MTLLLDTHVFLWWLVDHPRLREKTRSALEDAATVIHVSAASFWEIAIKAGLGRIDLGRVDLAAELEAGGFQELPIRARHALEVLALPRHHDDPFDRMLAAQARVEGLTLVSRDAIFARYGVYLLRA